MKPFRSGERPQTDPVLRRPINPAALAATVFLCAAALLHATEWSPSVGTNLTWDNNASNANRDSDRVAAWRLGGTASASRFHSLSREWRVNCGFAAAAEWWPQYAGLDRISGGANAALIWKPGLGPDAASWQLNAEAQYVGARESARSGTAGILGFAWRKGSGDAGRFQLGAQLTRQDARSAVFARTGGTIFAQFDRDLTERWRLTLRVSYRDGDIVSYATPPRPELLSRASAVMRENRTFDRNFVAYRLEAQTWSGVIGVTPALNDRTSLSFQLEWRESARGPIRYTNHLATAGLVRQF
jgi:hypothetical protein